MFKDLRKYIYMIWLGKKYIPIYHRIYDDASLSLYDRYHRLSEERQNYSKQVVEFLNVRPVVHGSLPEENKVLYVINHRSLLDIIVMETIFAAGPKAGMWIAKQTLLDNRIYGKFFEYSGCIAVDLQEGKGLLTFFKTIKQVLSEAPDLNLYIFPEGERYGGEGIGPFQPGAEKIARANKMTVVPVFINDRLEKVFKAAPFKTPYDVHVHIGAPVDPKNIEAEYHAFMKSCLDT